jgi:hypothetical protein
LLTLVKDEAGLIDIFKYITQNSVKEGLVDHPKDWKGLHGYHQLVMNKSVRGPWVNRTAYYWAKQRHEDVTLDQFTTQYQVDLSPPPMWSSYSRQDYQQLCKKLCAEAIQVAKRQRIVSTPMGMKKVLREGILKARFTKRSTRPLCRTKCIQTLKEYQKLYFTFKANFQDVSAQLRSAIRSGGEAHITIRFPAGGVPLFGGKYSPG